jgi:hypothetical protein
MSNQKNDWVQTYGNDSTHLKSGYANILAVDYRSDGKTLNATLWLKSNSENALTYSQPFKKIRYGMLIAIASLPPTSGYNGANYDFYIEAVNGKWSQYLYLLSSTGTRSLVYSKINYTQSFELIGVVVGATTYCEFRPQQRPVSDVPCISSRRRGGKTSNQIKHSLISLLLQENFLTSVEFILPW